MNYKKLNEEAITGAAPKASSRSARGMKVAAPGTNAVMSDSMSQKFSQNTPAQVNTGTGGINLPFDPNKVNATVKWTDAATKNSMTYNPTTKKTTVQPYIAPSSVYTPTSNKYSDSSKIGIRQFLNNLGYDNNTITFENGVVKVGGRDFIRPTVNEDGTTYADIYSLQRAADDYYKNSGSDNQLVAAANYAAVEGIGAALQYNNNGTVTVGGIAIPGQVVVDGVAYATKNAIKNAFDEYRISAGVQKQRELYDEYMDTFGDRINQLQDEISDFRYNPESDPAYQAYKDVYTRLGEQAMQDAYGNAAARTGGFGSSAAIAAGQQAYNNYMQQLDAIVPQLEQQNYNRKLNELALYGNPSDRFGWLLDINNQDYDRMINSQQMDYERRSFDQNYRANEQAMDIAANQEQRAQELHEANMALNNIEIQYAGQTLSARVKSALYSALIQGESYEQAALNNDILAGSKDAIILSEILGNEQKKAQIQQIYAQNNLINAQATSIPYENAYTQSQTDRNNAETRKIDIQSDAMKSELSGNSTDNNQTGGSDDGTVPADLGNGGSTSPAGDPTKYEEFWDSGSGTGGLFDNSGNPIITFTLKK